MQEVNLYLHNTCVGINHCISQKENNLFIEATKSDLRTIEIALKAKYSKVAQEKEAKLKGISSSSHSSPVLLWFTKVMSTFLLWRKK